MMTGRVSLQLIIILFHETVRSEFEQKLQRQIDSCGPCCSCLVMIVMVVLFGIYVLGR